MSVLRPLAADWPTYMGDVRRSGISSEPLATNLAPAWIYPRLAQPTAAWFDEAARDYWGYADAPNPLQNRLDFDLVNHVAVAGGCVYVGASTEDTVNCLEAVTGELRWTFFTDAPVRMAPMVYGGNVYAGSDDGSVYCLKAATGALTWRYTPAGATNYLVPNNGGFVSPWAVRSGVVVDNGVAYCAAGIFPGQGVHLCALDAATGALVWKQTKINAGALQGYALLSAASLFVPGSRSNPYFCNRSNGSGWTQCDGNNAFGTFALLSGPDFFMGPARGGGQQITSARASGGAVLATYSGNAVVVTATNIFLLSDTGLAALTRPGGAILWRRGTPCTDALILAGATLCAGGAGQVAGFEAATGRPIWSVAVQGRARGLAVANGALYVSTDRGRVEAFIQNQPAKQSTIIVY